MWSKEEGHSEASVYSLEPHLFCTLGGKRPSCFWLLASGKQEVLGSLGSQLAAPVAEQ